MCLDKNLNLKNQFKSRNKTHDNMDLPVYLIIHSTSELFGSSTTALFSPPIPYLNTHYNLINFSKCFCVSLRKF